MINTGEKINNLYTVCEEIYRDVYVIENILTGEKFTLSRIKSPECINKLEIFKKLRHPLLPAIYEIINHKDQSYYISEFVNGNSLSKLLKKSKNVLSCEIICRYIAEYSKIIQLLHSQFKDPVSHLEISEDTIIISDKNTVHLLNYGFTGCKENLNFEDYDELMSIPEIEMYRKFDKGSDIYLIGKTLKSVLINECSKISFNSRTGEYMRGIPDAIEKIINKSTVKNPDFRYANVSELELDLLNACDTFLKNGIFPDINDFGALLREGKEKYELDGNEKDLAKKCESDLQHNKKCRIICVWDNAEFASELACVIADRKKDVLLIDADLLSPKIDLLIDLNLPKKTLENFESLNCLAEMMDEFSGKRLTPESIRENSLKTSKEHLRVVCGNYKVEDYEYYNTSGFARIITEGSGIFDFMVISVNKFIYDEFTCVSLIKGDIIFIPVYANNIQFREFNKYLHFLSGRKQLDINKVKFAGFDYHPNEDFSPGICDEMCRGKFAGTISYSPKRRMAKGSGKEYSSLIENKIEKQYLTLLKNAGIKI